MFNSRLAVYLVKSRVNIQSEVLYFLIQLFTKQTFGNER